MAQNLNIGQALVDVPFPELVSKLAISIAEAQLNLDTNSIVILKKMGDVKQCPVSLPYTEYVEALKGAGKNGNVFKDEEIVTSMIGAGFQPTFYQFAETIIEVKMTISASLEETTKEEKEGTQTDIMYSQSSSLWGLKKNTKMVITSTPINATYTNKYNYTAEGTSTLRTRLVPVPPNTIIERFIDLKSQMLTLKYQAEMAKYQAAIDKASDPNVEIVEDTNDNPSA